MKNLSQIPRKITAKFCYGLEYNDSMDNEIESSEKIKYEFEDNDKTVSPTEEEKNLGNLADSNEANNILLELVGDSKTIIVKDNPNDPELNKFPYEVKAEGLNNRQLEKNYAGPDITNLLASLGDRPGIIPNNFDPEDYDYEEA